jgi:trimethylamine:corrinoid methyltransferase-like protein
MDQTAISGMMDVSPGGHFLAQKHTRKPIRQRWIPELSHPGDMFDGKTQLGIRDRARAKLETIQAEHEPEPIDENVNVETGTILDAAE